MKIRRQKDSEPAPKNQLGRHIAAELLRAGEYGRLAELLSDEQAVVEGNSDYSPAPFLDAAQRICMACHQCRTEKEWHRQAYLETRQRERELCRLLPTIIDLIGVNEAPEMRPTAPDPRPACANEIEANRLDRRDVASAEPVNVIGHIRTLLHQDPGPWTPIPSPPLPIPDTAVSPAAEQNPKSPEVLPPREQAPAAVGLPNQKERHEEQAGSSLLIYCLGPFQVYQDDVPVEDWPNGKGKLIFKYLVAHRDLPVRKEILMELFWPNARPNAARNNLNVAIYGLRQVFSKVGTPISHVLFRDGCYLLNPELDIWVDCEVFVQRVAVARTLEQNGEEASAIQEYRAAESLYQGELLTEDRYEDWLVPLRQGLRDDYLGLLDRLYRYYAKQQDCDVCTSLCGKMLAVDSCNEAAHRRLMCWYSRSGRHHLALRQYHFCVEALAQELDVKPSQATMDVYEQIRQRQPV